MDKFNGFTLAEVLITLGILGVVAAMTLPALASKYKDKVLVSQAKKLYSETLNGIKMYTAKNYCANESCLFDTSKSIDEVNRELFKMFEGATYCEQGNQKPLCQKYMVLSYKKLNNGYGQTGYSDSITQPFILLKSGAVIKILQQNECPRKYESKVRDENGNFTGEVEIKTTEICANIYLDSNGPKGPNQRGADIFIHTFNIYNKFGTDGLFKNVLTEGKLQYTPYRVGVEY